MTDLKITIDGKEVEAREGEVIIAAAERAGIYIPRFCWHPRMKPVGMCRMCLVEVEGPRGPQVVPSCFVNVAEGQVVNTQETSSKARGLQEGMLELLLVNHPLDCPVCDKGGECPLQDQTLAHGPGETRFVEEKRHWEKPISLSSLVDIDRERCIQCARCTRFADEIAGDPLINFVNRGDHTEVNVFPDLPFSSYFSGNTVQICPVGALLARPYRFKARPWDLEQVESTCTVCSVGCRVAVQSSADDVTRYLGLDSDPVNQGWLCDKGRFSYEAVNHAARLTTPLVRKGDELVEASWGEALEATRSALADATRLHGPESVAVIGGARLPNEDAFVWAQLAKNVIGTQSVDAQLGDGLPADVVLGFARATIGDACEASSIVLLAPDLKEELPVLYLRLRQAATDNGVPLIELTPKATGLTPYARASLRYRPGEVAALAAALVGDQAPSTDVAGVPAAAIAAAGPLIGDRPVLVVGRPSLAESVDSVADAARTLARGLPGARVLPALRRANVHGAVALGMTPGDGGRDTAAVLRDAAEGRVQCLVLVGADPLDDFPDRELARRALTGAGTVIAVDTFTNASNHHADVVLAAATANERVGTTTNLEGRVTRVGQKVTAPGVAWPDWMIAVELASLLGTELPYTDTDAITDAIAAEVPGFAHVTAQALAAPGNADGLVLDGDALVRAHASPAAAGTGATPPPQADAYSLRLVSARELYDLGTIGQHSPSLAGLLRPNVLKVCTLELERLGLNTGDRVRVKSARTTLVLEVARDEGVPRGSAFLAFNAANPGAADLIDATNPVTEIRLENV